MLLLYCSKGSNKMFKVIFYKDKNGNDPIRDFLLNLSQKARKLRKRKARNNMKDFLERAE